MTNNKRGIIYAFVAVLFFSFSPIFGKVLLGYVSPFIILVLNQSLAGLIFILVLDFIREIKSLEQTSKHDMKILLSVTLFNGVLGPLLFLSGLSMTTATNTILLAKADVFLTGLLAIILLGEKITKKQIIGTLVIFFGIILIATENFANGLTFAMGDILIVSSAFCYSLGTVLFKKYLDHVSPEIYLTLQDLFGATVLFFLSIFLADFTNLQEALSIKFVLFALLLVVLVSIVGKYLWYKALETTSATNVVLVSLASPLVAIFYTHLFLSEKLNSAQFSGGMFIMIGIIIMELHFNKIHSQQKRKKHLKLRHHYHT